MRMTEGSSSGPEDFSDTIFWFLHENSPLPETFSGSSGTSLATDDCDQDNGEHSSVNSDQEKLTFWNHQLQLLQETLYRTNSTESRVRQATVEALTESPERRCHCRRAVVAASVCKTCSRKHIVNRLSHAGFDCSIRNSKWKSSSQIPSGEHTYLEVVEKDEEKVIVELEFRAEFEMARAGEDYDRLVSNLPEVFVGKPERLTNVVKIICGAAKRSMKEKKLHMGPWRKLKYMQAKWLSSTSTAATCQVPGGYRVAGLSGGRPKRPRASLLTFALRRNLSGSHQVVAVV